MKVLLVNPPVEEKTPAPIAAPPLGLAYLAASLAGRGIEATVLDADALGTPLSEVADTAAAGSFDVVGVTAMTPTVEAAYHTLEALRPVSSFLVMGGAHASALGPALFDDCPTPLDASVCGEAEQTFPELVSKVATGDRDSLAALPGVLLPGQGKEEAEWPKVLDLDSLAFPDRLGLPWKKYRHPLFGGETVTSIITSRGCPYRCVFCDKHVCGSRWRARSPGNVLAELDEIVLKTGVRRIIIYDDLFTLQKERVIDICCGIIDRGIEIQWKCEGRVNRVDPETLAWMKRAGCRMIAYGVESATEHGLSFLHKDLTVEQAREAFAMTRKAGIQTLGYFILGIPGETVEQEMETIRLAVSLGADYAQFGVLSPFPGTPLYDYASERGWVKDLPARGPAERGTRRPLILDGYWTLERLDRITRMAHRKFYFRPGYVAKRLFRVRSASELIAGAAQALRLARWWAGGRRSS